MFDLNVVVEACDLIAEKLDLNPSREFFGFYCDKRAFAPYWEVRIFIRCQHFSYNFRLANFFEGLTFTKHQIADAFIDDLKMRYKGSPHQFVLKPEHRT